VRTGALQRVWTDLGRRPLAGPGENLAAVVTWTRSSTTSRAMREGSSACDCGAQRPDGGVGRIAKHFPGRPPANSRSGATLIDGTGRAPVTDSVVRDSTATASWRPDPAKASPSRGRDGRGVQRKDHPAGLVGHARPLRTSGVGTGLPGGGVTTVRDCGNEFEFITACGTRFATATGWARDCCWRESSMAALRPRSVCSAWTTRSRPRSG